MVMKHVHVCELNKFGTCFYVCMCCIVPVGWVCAVGLQYFPGGHPTQLAFVACFE